MPLDVAPQPQDETPGAGISNAVPPEPEALPSKFPEAPSNKTDQKGPPATPPVEEAGQPIEDSSFLPNDNAARLKKILGLRHSDPHLEEMLRNAQLRLTKDGQGLLIDMVQNGHTVHCGKLKDGSEFIGMPHKKMIVDEHDAEVMVGLAKARGWTALNVTGSQAEKELLWLEAQRRGLAVANFQPDPNSEVMQKWLKEDAERPKPSLTEAKPEDFHQKTIALLTEKAAALTDKDAKAGVEAILKKFTENAVTGNEDIYKGLAQALAGKDARAGYNQAVDLLNKAEPKLGLTPLEAATPAAAANEASKPAPPRPAAPAPKMG